MVGEFRRFAGPMLAGCMLSVVGCAEPWQGWDRIFLQSPGPPRTSPADLGLDYEDVRIVSANGKTMAGWFVPPTDGAAEATFLVHTGMRGNLDTYLAAVPWAARNGFNLLVYDWQGFGASEGVPNFANFEPDTRAAVEYLLARPDLGVGIIQLGASLGSICALAAARDYPDETVGLILYGASFTEDMASSWLTTQVDSSLLPFGVLGDVVWTALLPPFFNAHQYLEAVRVPILAITPADDTIVPPIAQQHLYDLLPEPKQRYFTYGGHVHAPDTDMQLEPIVVEWTRAVLAERVGL